MKEKDENSARAIYVASDTAGSLFTGAPNGGMVLIAGKNQSLTLITYRKIYFNTTKASSDYDQ